MRYSIMDKGLGMPQIDTEVRRLGAKSIQRANVLGQVFCELDAVAAGILKSVPGVLVKPINKTAVPGRVKPSPVPVSTMALQPVYSGFTDTLAAAVWSLRNILTPAVIGEGYTIAVLDTGIRKTHRTLFDKVVYEKNFTASPSVDDVFDHGTGVAFAAAGGRAVEGEEQGIAPGAKLMNMKVLSDEGLGTDEMVILAIDDLLALREKHDFYDPMFPNLANMSLGAPDDGDPDNPLRVAVNSAVYDHKLACVCAAGNSGPSAGTIDLPGAARWPDCVGCLEYAPFAIWEHSSRGPTKEGFVKPDLVWYGANRLVASSASDDAFTTKSGTSFATPGVSGIGMLVYEYWARVTGYQFMEIGAEEVEAMYPAVCVKPSGSPVEKDNTYGFGLPLGTLMSRAFTAEPITGAITAVVMMTAMAMLVKSMVPVAV